MSQHYHPDGHGLEFLVDHCPRCEEYVEQLGRPFDPERFTLFWEKMVRVEWDHDGNWWSSLDRELGRRLYLVSLQLQAAFGLHPRDLPTFRERFERVIAALPD